MNSILGLLNPYLMWIKLGLVAAVALGSFYAGYKITDNAWEAEQAQQYKKDMAAMVKMQGNARETGQKLAAEIAARTKDAQRHRQDVAVWQAKGTVNVTCPDQGVQAVPQAAVRFGADFVSEWNAGLCLGSIDPAACNRRFADAAASGAGATPGDILANQSDNAESCGKDRTTLAGWQALAVKNGWANKGVTP